METGKSVARLRFVRDLLGRTASEGEGDAEGGFTLIELMVVLLIMGILLAIAIPTFLSVTGGAKKTAAQSNLTDVMTSAQAAYTGNNGSFTVTTLVGTLTKTQSTIKFVTKTVKPAEGKNSVSVDVVGAQTVIFSAEDGAGVCWVAADNQTTNSVSKITKGDHYWGITAGATGCKAELFIATATLAPTGTAPSVWGTNFSTIKTPKT